MSEYYLMSQLPSLDGIGDNTELPIDEERFIELCRRFLGKKAMDELEGLALVPNRSSKVSKSHLINAWNEGERNLRLALCKVRAEKLKKSFEFTSEELGVLSVGLIKTAQTASDMESPMEAEKYLNGYRLDYLESLRPIDGFSEEAVYYYWLKLKLLLRIKQFDTQKGEEAYRKIYNSIMSGDKSEVEK